MHFLHKKERKVVRYAIEGIILKLSSCDLIIH